MDALPAGRFLGTTLDAREIGAFRLTESVYTSGALLPRHSHERAHFCYVLGGAYTEQIGPLSHSRQPNSLFFYPPDLSHSERHEQPGRHFLIEVDSSRPSPASPALRLPREPIELSAGRFLEVAGRLYHEFRCYDSLSPLAIEGCAYELLAYTCRE